MSSLFTSIPEEVVTDIIARVPRCDYPTLSLVSKRFRSLVASPEIYTRRSVLNCTEHCVYVALNNLETYEARLYTLFRNRLVLIPSLPAMPSDARFVAVGSKIYVVSGVHSEGVMMSIDCRSHSVQTLPSLPIPKNVSAAGAIDGKIYVILNPGDWMLPSDIIVFDTRTEKWECGVIKPDIDVDRVWPGCVVMDDKIYMSDLRSSFFYDPKESKWGMEKEMLNFEHWVYVCSVEDVLYHYDGRESELKGYDPKQKCWIVVKGVEELSRQRGCSWAVKMVGYGRKLVVFFPKSKRDGELSPEEIWCAEIALEKGQGEIWGKVEWCEVVLDGRFSPKKPVAVVM